MKRIPLMIGNTRIRDHVSGIITTGPPPATPLYPDWTLDQMMRSIWRVKSWSLTGSFKLVVKFDFGGGNTSTWTGTILDQTLTMTDRTSGLVAVDETSAVGNVYTWFTTGHSNFAQILGMLSVRDNSGGSDFSFNNVYTGFMPGPPVFTTVSALVGLIPPAPIFPSVAMGSLFKEPIPLIYGIDVFYNTPAQWQFHAAVSVFGVFPNAVGSNLTWDGIAYPLYYDFTYSYDHVVFPTPPIVTTTFTGSIDVAALEYWPYDNMLGQAVYDTVSGAVINDPFA